MPQVQAPKPQPAGENAGKEEEWIRLNITLYLPKHLHEKMLEYMKQKGYRTTAEFLRDLIREAVGDQ